MEDPFYEYAQLKEESIGIVNVSDIHVQGYVHGKFNVLRLPIRGTFLDEYSIREVLKPHPKMSYWILISGGKLC